jgi:biotin synthase-like enzyme
MAFELAEIDPTSVPINLLNPRAGTKFGDRPLMDPWEVVKWVAIFRLILPDALFRLCGGRVENLEDLQPLAVKAGLNGVMMGNFLTTLGAEPADDRAMFEDLGLDVARQPGRRELLGSLHAAAGDQEAAQAAPVSRALRAGAGDGHHRAAGRLGGLTSPRCR